MSLAAKHVHFEDCDLEIGVRVCVCGDMTSARSLFLELHNTTQRGCARFLPIYTAHFLPVGTNDFFRWHVPQINSEGHFPPTVYIFSYVNAFLSAWHQICCLECKAEVDWIGRGWSVEDGSYLCVRITRSLPSNSFSRIFEEHNSWYSYLDIGFICDVE